MKIRTAATAALALTTALILAGCSDTGNAGGGMSGMDHGGSSSSAAPTADASANANDADIMFATMMIPHHQQAIEMSDVLLSKDDIDPRVVDLADGIKAAQQPEIDTLNGWLQEWGADTSGTDMDGMDHGGGMMSEEDMQALDAATGTEAAKLFLEQMIEHHNGAIEMAQEEVNNGQNPNATALAQKIVDDQTAEIAAMEDILAGL
ncbi:DUF305 domain-containing protein [Microbacterium sp.]|uniref:DUF305 domain-containing protein n=1 Tax=Microbacterium sp. TaxID=51671 RepID=UPI003736239E